MRTCRQVLQNDIGVHDCQRGGGACRQQQRWAVHGLRMRYTHRGASAQEATLLGWEAHRRPHAAFKKNGPQWEERVAPLLTLPIAAVLPLEQLCTA